MARSWPQIEPAMDDCVQLAVFRLNMQELIDPLLERSVARQRIRFLAEIEWLVGCCAITASFGMQLVLKSRFRGIGDH